MTLQKACRRRAIVVCFLFIIPVLARVPNAAGQKITSIEVVFDQKATAFSAYDPALVEEVRVTLLREAVEQLGTTFPFFDWCIGGTTSAPTGLAANPLLTITMRSERGLGEWVYLSCIAQIPGLRDIDLSLKADVFARDDFIPELSSENREEVRRILVERGQDALKTLIPSNRDIWQTKIISQISLATDVVPAPTDHRLIVPVAATRLNAGEESILLIRFQGQVPPENAVAGMIEVSPSGAVLRAANDPLRGMQSCRVTSFDYAPDDAKQWHDRIPIVIGHRLPNTLGVFMKKYVAESTRLSFEP